MEEKRLDSPKRELSLDQLEKVREAWSKFRVERKLPMGQMEDLVWNFIDSISRTTRAILPLAKLKEHDEYTFVHSVNVSLLVLARRRDRSAFRVRRCMRSAWRAAARHRQARRSAQHSQQAGKLDSDDWETMKPRSKVRGT
jgi:hypothetical protein